MINLRTNWPTNDTNTATTDNYKVRAAAWRSNTVFLPGSHLARGLVKAFVFSLGWPGEVITNFQNKCGVQHAVSTNVAKAATSENSWNFTDAANNYFITVNDCGLASASKATINMKTYLLGGSVAANRCVCEFTHTTGDPRFGMELGGASNRCGAFANGTTAYGLTANNTAVTGWQEWTMVFDGTGVGNAGRLKVYKGTVQVGLTYTGTVAAAISSAVSRIEIGRILANAVVTDATGNYHQVLIWNRALTPTEIAELKSTPAYGDLITNRMTASNYSHRLVMPPLISGAIFRNRMASRAGLGRHLSGVGNSV
jgi:hypothetical protein